MPNTQRLLAEPLFAEPMEVWRTFDVTTSVEVLKPSGVTRVWLPAALISKTPYQNTLSNYFTAEGGTAKMVEIKQEALGIVAATFPAGVRPVVTVTSRIVLINYAVDLAAPGHAPQANAEELRYFLRPTKLIPTGGIVKEAALEATRGAKTEIEKARAIYEWMVDNTFRNPKTRGCGLGDISFMLESRTWAASASTSTRSTSGWRAR